MELDQKYMTRAFDLAKMGTGEVSPNPLVGAVITLNGEIIGEGWHQKFGASHAEVNALNSIKEKVDLSKATIYINLEPCSHFGKTPPCADLIIHNKFKKVVISNIDPNPEVNGKGVEKIKQSGIEILVGVLENEGRYLNRRFFKFYDSNRPYIILKWAQTADGFIAQNDFSSKWISNDLSRELVHCWRSEEDAVLVGTNTAIYDNPKLTVRNLEGKNPIRIFIDNDLKVPNTHSLYSGEVKTICFNLKKEGLGENVEFIKQDRNSSLLGILKILHAKKVQSIIIEGGAAILNSFITENLWDEARVFSSPKIFNSGIAAPRLDLNSSKTKKIGLDSLSVIFN